MKLSFMFGFLPNCVKGIAHFECKFTLFLTYETEFVLFLTVLENSVLPMG